MIHSSSLAMRRYSIGPRTRMLRLNKKNFEDEELPHELFLITRQTKIRNAL